MARKEMQFRSIADLDPASAVLFDDFIKECVKDCRDRAALDKPRKVILTLTMIPDADDKGDMDGVKMNFKVRCTVPEQGGRTFSLAATNAGHLSFNDTDPTSYHKQSTIDEAINPPRDAANE